MSMHNHPEVVTYKKSPFVTNAVAVDAQTVRLEFDSPHPEMMVKLATWHGGDWEMLKPKHYLSKWHIDFNDKANEVAKEEGHETWQQAFTDHFFWKPSTDLDLPVIQAWRFTEITPTVRVFERNPYYLRVDTAGNQLPYIDRIVSTVVEKEVYNLKIIGGEADLAYGQTSLENFALYKENEEAGDYRVTLIPGLSAAEVGLVLNQNHLQEWRAELYQDIRFRRALSLAINRDEVNEQVFFGLSTPRQAAVPPVHSYYQEEWGKAWADYDPDQANALLDEIGMTDRTRDGFRRAPGGEELQILIEYAEGLPVPAMELIKEYWEAVGVKVLLKVETGQSRNVTRTLNEHDVRGERHRRGIGDRQLHHRRRRAVHLQPVAGRDRGLPLDAVRHRQRLGLAVGQVARRQRRHRGRHPHACRLRRRDARLGAAAGDQGSGRVVVGDPRHRVRLPRVRRAGNQHLATAGRQAVGDRRGGHEPDHLHLAQQHRQRAPGVQHRRRVADRPQLLGRPALLPPVAVAAGQPFRLHFTEARGSPRLRCVRTAPAPPASLACR